MQKIDYEAWGKITFNTDHALFADGPGRFPVTFFHLGMFFQKAVDLRRRRRPVARDRLRSELFRHARRFDRTATAAGRGLRRLPLQEPRDGALDWHKNDWVAFLGASYFRSIGELYQYGLSARGIALDVAVADRPEEFPDFTNFYIDATEGPTASSSTPCSKARRSSAPIAS